MPLLIAVLWYSKTEIVGIYFSLLHHKLQKQDFVYYQVADMQSCVVEFESNFYVVVYAIWTNKSLFISTYYIYTHASVYSLCKFLKLKITSC